MQFDCLTGGLMKKIFALLALSVAFVLITGCASTGDYETRLRPPQSINPIFMRYKQLPEPKVFVVAVDPTGQWAFGYDHGASSLEEAARMAAIKCDAAREKHQVFATAKLFAINDDVVYYDQP
jgi:hypothetical protein